MGLLEQSFRLRTIFLFAGSLSILLTFVVVRSGASKAWSKKPSVQLQASKALLTYPCPPGFHSTSRSCPTTADLQIDLLAITKDFNKRSMYAYTVSGGRIVGDGSKVIWDFTGFGPGMYAATVEVRDNKKHHALSSVTVTIQVCGDCVTEMPCPLLSVNCYDEVKAGTSITCKLVVGASSRRGPMAFEWSARDWNGEDLSERISGRDRSITIRTDGLGGRHLNTTVNVKGLDPSCSTSATASTTVKP